MDSPSTSTWLCRDATQALSFLPTQWLKSNQRNQWAITQTIWLFFVPEIDHLQPLQTILENPQNEVEVQHVKVCQTDEPKVWKEINKNQRELSHLSNLSLSSMGKGYHRGFFFSSGRSVSEGSLYMPEDTLLPEEKKNPRWDTFPMEERDKFTITKLKQMGFTFTNCLSLCLFWNWGNIGSAPGCQWWVPWKQQQIWYVYLHTLC